MLRDKLRVFVSRISPPLDYIVLTIPYNPYIPLVPL